jgi:hypothetical protein
MLEMLCAVKCDFLGTSIKILHSWIKIPFETGPELEIPVFHGHYLRRMYILIYKFQPVSLQ